MQMVAAELHAAINTSPSKAAVSNLRAVSSISETDISSS